VEIGRNAWTAAQFLMLKKERQGTERAYIRHAHIFAEGIFIATGQLVFDF